MLDLVHALATGVASAGAWPVPVFLLLGVGIGAIVGLLPGLGAPAMLTLLIPFTLTLDPLPAMALLMSAAAVTATTGDLSSILLGVPGEAVSAALVVDGHALAKSGQAGRALGAALMSSLVGAVFGVVAFVLAIPVARSILTAIGSPELFMLTIAGIAFIAPLVGPAPLKGLTTGALGLLLATVGLDAVDSTPRFTFGALFLWDGLGVLPVVLGLFAIPEALALVSSNRSPAPLPAAEPGGVARGMWDALRHWPLVLRCSAIGTYIGMLPGPGGSIAQWVAYAHAVGPARTKGHHGHGVIEGVIGPGAANNSALGGALLPTLALGIPGSLTTAILLSALSIKGMIPGDTMLLPDAAGGRLNLVMALMWFVVIANVVVVALFAGLLTPLSRLANVRGTRLVPVVLFLTFVGAYMERNTIEDLLIVAGSGMLGWVMLKLDWPRAPLLLGLILGSLAENRMFLSVSLYGWSWWHRPGVLLIGVAVVGCILAGVWRRTRSRSGDSLMQPDRSERVRRRSTGDLVFCSAIVLLSIAAFQMTAAFGPRASLFPRVIIGALCVLAVAQLAIECRGTASAGHAAPISSAAPLWVAAFLAGVWLLGFDIGAPLVTLAFLRLGARDSWQSAVGQALAVALFVVLVLETMLAVPLPPGVFRAVLAG